ncbi:MAG: hypothetical protein RIT43_251 [Bacteroidota bacterium]
MKNHLTALLLFFAATLNAQLSELHLKNALVVGQLDKPEDRYTIEINLTELLSDAGIKAIPSLNMMKLGSDASMLAGDSIQRLVAAKGIDTYIIVSVRGFDRKFKPSERKDDLNTTLGAGSLFPIFREEVVSVSFEFLFFRNGQFIASDIVKCGNVSERDTVIKRFRKKVAQRIEKKWK